MKPTSNESIKHKLINSGVFKLKESKEQPGLGIFKVVPSQKNRLSTKIFIPCERQKLLELISGLLFEIARSRSAQDVNLLNELLQDFEKEVESLLDRWDLTPHDLTPHYAGLVKKAKRCIRTKKTVPLKGDLKSLSDIEKTISRWDTKKALRYGAMIYHMVNTFKKYTKKISLNNIFRSIAFLLIACGIEEDRPQPIFEKIRTAYRRYPKTKP